MQEQTFSTWKIDPGHSNIQFKIKHLGIANVAGSFDVFDGLVTTTNDDFTDAEVTLEIDTNSINTNNKLRDEHLRSDIFFDAEQFPKITFKGTLKKAADGYELNGELNIRDVSKMVTLQTEITGTGQGRAGDIRVGFELKGEVNRKDYGLSFNMLTDAGSLIVGDTAKLQMDIELIKN